jgi:electron transport complex protein RnfB
MSDEVFEQLADALDRLPNGFPRTPTGLEIRILKKIFSPEEAAIAVKMSGKWETVDEIAARLDMPEREALNALKQMARRGLIFGNVVDRKRYYRQAPFVVGIYEAQLENMDHEFAHMHEEYMAQGGAAGIMKPQPALHRVVPARGTAKTEWVLPYDDVKELLMNAKTFRVRDCICRVQKGILGEACDAPVHNCLSFYDIALPETTYDLTKEQALAVLDEAEKAALVHTVSNVAKGVNYFCNCCGCCCGILRSVTEFGIQESVAAANYYVVVDEDACTACGICEGRCQVGAITIPEAVSVVDRSRCIGCGLCVTGCPEDAIALHLKPESEIVRPPEDFPAWERERLKNRGLA